MTQSPPVIAILGAGPCGIATAYFAQAAGYKVVLIEKEQFVGGKGASLTVDKFILDFGPHTYHPRTEEINNLMVPHAGDDYILTEVQMELVLKGKRLGYPFRPTEALFRFNPLFSLKMGLDYLLTVARNKISPMPERSFRDYGIKHFGKTLYDLCFGDYTERVWGIPASEISVELARKKLPKFSLTAIVLEYLTGKHRMDEHIITPKVGYHRRGIGEIYKNIVQSVRKNGGEVITGATVEKLNRGADGKVSSIRLSDSGGSREIACDYLISTIPLPELNGLLSTPVFPPEWANGKLDFRDIVLVYPCISRAKFSSAHWIYLVDDRFKFQRLSEQKNLSADCCPAESTVITMEISCPASSPMWNWSPEQFKTIAAADLEYFGVKPEEITQISVQKLKDAYPVYRSGYQQHLRSAFDALAGVPNLVTTGRQGLFLDIGMHDAMALGKRAFEHLTSGKVDEFYRSHPGFSA